MCTNGGGSCSSSTSSTSSKRSIIVVREVVAIVIVVAVVGARHGKSVKRYMILKNSSKIYTTLTSTNIPKWGPKA